MQDKKVRTYTLQGGGVAHLVVGDIESPIEYAYYRFIPNWRMLYRWYSQGQTAGTWNPILARHRHAEDIAREFTSYEDVKAHDKRQADLYREHIKNAEKFTTRNQPYETKMIIDSERDSKNEQP